MRIVATGLGTAMAALLAASPPAFAEAKVDLHAISASGVGEKIGTATLSDSEKGLVIDVTVSGLAPGSHGFHVHENGDCGPGVKDGKMAAGLAAGGHYDPADTNRHAGPSGSGHRGDLPVLTTGPGETETSLTAERLKLSEIRGRALVIHEGGDTYSDTPELGGGGGRVACGVVPKS